MLHFHFRCVLRPFITDFYLSNPKNEKKILNLKQYVSNLKQTLARKHYYIYICARKFIILIAEKQNNIRMKHYLTLAALSASVALLNACSEGKADYPTPQFESFTYTGNDARYNQPFNPTTQYLNPIISGTNPDPTICRKGDDFFMANSSFVYWPGIPVWHSKDLIDWDFCGYVITRPSQALFKTGDRISGGVFAPDMKYCAANNTFYLIVTIVTGGGNVIFKSQNPYEGWSEPISVPEVHGIDPSMLFDADGKCYIVNNDEPAYPAEYSGHRAIWAREFDLKTDKVCGDPVVLIDKGIRPEEKPIWIEGPHLYHFNQTLAGKTFNQYYLMDAEGGTGDWHSEVVLASNKPLGKFTPSQQNPILTQRTQPHNRPNPITCAGHADLVNVNDNPAVEDNEWWSVFLACTTYDGDQLYNTGRSTFLLPTSWIPDAKNKGIQPLILHPDSIIPTVCAKSQWQLMAETKSVSENAELVGNQADKRNLLTGNGSYQDSFDGADLYPLWFTLRTPEADQRVEGRLAKWLNVNGGRLLLEPRPVQLSEQAQPSMVCRWIKNNTYTVQTQLLYTPAEQQTLAGLTLFQSERAHYILGKRLNADAQMEVVLIRSTKEESNVVVAKQTLSKAEGYKPIELRAEVDQHVATFSYSVDGGATFQTIGEAQNADILTTNYAGGFTGSVAGLCAIKE